MSHYFEVTRYLGLLQSRCSCGWFRSTGFRYEHDARRAWVHGHLVYADRALYAAELARAGTR